MYIYIYIYIFVSLYLYVPDEGSLLPKYRDCTTYNDFELYIYIYSIVFWDVGMPLLESKLLCLLLNPVEIGPSNTSPG